MVNSHLKMIQYSRLVTSRATRDVTDAVLPFHLTTVRDLHLQTLKMPTRIQHTKISKAALRIVLWLLLFEVFKSTATQTAKLDCMHYKSRNLSTLLLKPIYSAPEPAPFQHLSSVKYRNWAALTATAG